MSHLGLCKTMHHTLWFVALSHAGTPSSSGTTLSSSSSSFLKLFSFQFYLFPLPSVSIFRKIRISYDLFFFCMFLMIQVRCIYNAMFTLQHWWFIYTWLIIDKFYPESVVCWELLLKLAFWKMFVYLSSVTTLQRWYVVRMKNWMLLIKKIRRSLMVKRKENIQWKTKEWNYQKNQNINL